MQTVILEIQTEPAVDLEKWRTEMRARQQAFEAALPAHLKPGARPAPGRLNDLDRENNYLIHES